MATSSDYVIVGGGVAGLTLAMRLSKLLPNRTITVVEAGDDPSVNANVMSPAGFLHLFGSPQAWPVPCAANANLDDRARPVVVGKALSGSAALNASVWSRGPASSYELWAQTVGDSMWSYDAMLPYFKLTETDRNPGATAGQHDEQGSITVSSVKSQHPARHYPLRGPIMQAFAEAGVKYNSDPNDGHPNGLAENVETWLKGRRQLPSQQLDLSRVTILANSTVRRALLSEDTLTPRATGVELHDGTIITAKQEVILSAGTYHSPHLLLLSGIGAQDHLEAHGIKPRVNNPAVGANFTDHLALHMIFELQPTVAESGVAIPHPQFLSNGAFLAGNAVDFIHFNTLSGPEYKRTATLQQLNTSHKDAALVCQPNVTHYESIISYAPFPFLLTGVPDRPPAEALRGDRITTTVVMLTPTSRGCVSLSSSSPSDEPHVAPNTFATANDRFIMREAVRAASRIWTETPTGQATVAREIVPEGHEAVLPGTSDEAIDKRLRALAVGFNHPMGTCRMAKRQPGPEEGVDGGGGGVVDSHCRVFGIEALRVVDASVFPVPIAGQIQAAVYALAERMAVVVGEEARQ